MGRGGDSMNEQPKLRVLDLFSGIGGFSLGLERTGGFETVAFCEIEPFPRRVLAKHWPEVPCYHDVRELTAARLAADGIAVDVITGGFPCQDISLQGFRAGIVDGTRSGLWSEIYRLAGELRPEFIILENVSALLGNGMGRVLGDLAAGGYHAEWDCIPASFIGAPSERDRIWVVAYPAEKHGSAADIKRIFDAAQWEEARRSAIGGGFVCEHEGAATVRLGSEPALCSLDDGLSYGLVQRNLAAYGNTVHPVIPQGLGNAILQSRRIAA